MADLPDEELVAAALRGDADRFMELCRRHYPALVAVAHAVLGDRHLAEDAAQEALAKVCRSLPGLANPASFASWAAAICRNQARDLARRSIRAESLGDRDVAVSSPEPDPRIEAVREAVASLPAEARELVYLHYDGGLSYERISELLGLSAEAINGRLRRARQAIRDHLVRTAGRGGLP